MGHQADDEEEPYRPHATTRGAFNRAALALNAAQAVKKQMELSGTTNFAMGAMIGKTEAETYRILEGYEALTLETLADMATALGTRVKVVFEPDLMALVELARWAEEEEGGAEEAYLEPRLRALRESGFLPSLRGSGLVSAPVR